MQFSGVFSPDAEPVTAATEIEVGDVQPVSIPADYLEATDPKLPFSFRLPSSWVWASLDRGVAGLGTRFAPDSPQLAEQLDQGFQGLQEGAALIGFDSADLHSAALKTHVLVVELPSGSSAGDLADPRLLDVFLRAYDGSVLDTSYIEGAAGPIPRIRFKIHDGIFYQGFLYVVTAGEASYTLTLYSDDIEAYTQVADAMAASFKSNPL